MTGRRQPQRIPPPIDHGDEKIDAEPVLRDYPGELGIVLWKTVRSVRLWTGIAKESREAAFRPDAYDRRIASLDRVAEDAGVRASLEVAASVLKGAEASADEVARACARVADWAEACGRTATALEFVQAAAFARPADAELARRTAKLAGILAQHGRAESWGRHTLVVARASRQWDHFVYALLTLSLVARFRGNLQPGKRMVQRAIRVAKRHSLREPLGYSYAVLIGATSYGKIHELERYARGAMEALGPGHPAISDIAHDMAMNWMDSTFFDAALEVFTRLPSGRYRVDQQLGMSANLARAAAGAGELETYREARDRCERLLLDPATRLTQPVSLVNLARAALLVGDWDYAEAAAERAEVLARELGHGQDALSAEAARDAARAERLAGSAARRDATPAAPAAVARLAADLAAAMSPAGAPNR